MTIIYHNYLTLETRITPDNYQLFVTFRDDGYIFASLFDARSFNLDQTLLADIEDIKEILNPDLNNYLFGELKDENSYRTVETYGEYGLDEYTELDDSLHEFFLENMNTDDFISSEIVLEPEEDNNTYIEIFAKPRFGHKTKDYSIKQVIDLIFDIYTLNETVEINSYWDNDSGQFEDTEVYSVSTNEVQDDALKDFVDHILELLMGVYTCGGSELVYNDGAHYLASGYSEYGYTLSHVYRAPTVIDLISYYEEREELLALWLQDYAPAGIETIKNMKIYLGEFSLHEQ